MSIVDRVGRWVSCYVLQVCGDGKVEEAETSRILARLREETVASQRRAAIQRHARITGQEPDWKELLRREGEST